MQPLFSSSSSRTKLPSFRLRNGARKSASKLNLTTLGFLFVLALVALMCLWFGVIQAQSDKESPSNSSSSSSNELKDVSRTLDILSHSYITLWLHQFHRWFGDESVRLQGVKQFVGQAKEAGFGAIMVDLPWEWTEREKPGDYNIHSFQKDWIGSVCEAGLQLHIVLTMRELPPWLDKEAHSDYMEVTSQNCEPKSLKQKILQPSSAHPDVWNMMQAYVGNTTQLLTQAYGDCLASISPTFNNEFETRYTQTNNIMRDYSPSAIQLYQQWQRDKLHKTPEQVQQSPPNILCNTHCKAINKESELEWMAFREDFLVDRYINLCRMAKTAASSGRKRPLNCLLHMGEMLATTDHLNSNLFFQLATSDAVDEIVMDSNMMLLGAPASPSVVGLMVSLARGYSNKIIHYELATERVLPCNDAGQVVSVDHVDPTRGANLLIRTGVLNSLNAGVQSLGVTNLCKPEQAQVILPIEPDKAGNGNMHLLTSKYFTPTAVLYVPYRVFYSYSFAISGISCNLDPVPCWHPSFAEMDFFGMATLMKKHKHPGACPTDVAQATVLEAWDDLRLRHAQVAVVGDVNQLERFAEKAKERVLIRFPCVMQDKIWRFWQGEETRETFEAIHRKYPFTEKRDTKLC